MSAVLCQSPKFKYVLFFGSYLYSTLIHYWTFTSRHSYWPTNQKLMMITGIFPQNNKQPAGISSMSKEWYVQDFENEQKQMPVLQIQEMHGSRHESWLREIWKNTKETKSQNDSRQKRTMVRPISHLNPTFKKLSRMKGSFSTFDTRRSETFVSSLSEMTSFRTPLCTRSEKSDLQIFAQLRQLSLKFCPLLKILTRMGDLTKK